MPNADEALATSPVADEGGTDPGQPESGVALCLSGGGYRAMLFHVGALWRLNELGYLPKLDRVSSVSGGSITAATLGPELGAARLRRRRRGQRASMPQLVDARSARWRARRSTRARSSAASCAAQDDRRQGRRRLPQAPVRRRDAAGAARTGRGSSSTRRTCRPAPLALLEAVHGGLPGRRRTPNPTSQLAVAVAASSAFPPVLSPRAADVRSRERTPREGRGPAAHASPYTTDVVLTRRRRLRQPRARDGLEALHDDPRQRRRRPDGSPSRSRTATGRATRSASTRSSTTRCAACASGR